MTDSNRLAIFLSTSGHSGVDRVAKNLIPEIARRGIQVDLLHVENHGPYLENIPENVRVVRLGSRSTYTSLFPLIRYLKAHQPLALLSDKDKVNRIALIARRLAGVDTRCAVRNGTTVSRDFASRKPLDRWMQYQSMHRLYRWADAILVPSQGAADDMALTARIPRSRITAVPSPVVSPEILTKAQAAVNHPWLHDPEYPLILGVGELSARKDYATLIRAFSLARAERKCRLMILGEGRQRQALLDLARELGVHEDIQLPGFADNPYALLANADLFAHASTFEGSPVALMEAVALGTPCVTTDCPSGPKEILQDGKYGRLVPIGDFKAMAEAIVATLASPPSRDFVREAATPYTVQASADAYLRALGFTAWGLATPSANA